MHNALKPFEREKSSLFLTLRRRTHFLAILSVREQKYLESRPLNSVGHSDDVLDDDLAPTAEEINQLAMKEEYRQRLLPMLLLQLAEM